jgi:hypothetical protein
VGIGRILSVSASPDARIRDEVERWSMQPGLGVALAKLRTGAISGMIDRNAKPEFR